MYGAQKSICCRQLPIVSAADIARHGRQVQQQRTLNDAIQAGLRQIAKKLISF
jgi:hypothetical protein